MTLWETLALAVALGCDAFAVGLALGGRFGAPRQLFRLSFHFGLFQFGMPLIGWALGAGLATVTARYAPWLAAAVLLFIGGRMVWEALRPPEERAEGLDPTKGWSLVALSLATSIDALGVGLSLGMVGQNVLGAAVIIGVVAAVMTLGAMKLAGLMSAKLGHRMGVVGGVILIAIAIKLVAF
ncbi:MAG: manganese efflux pump MntP family protein [Desulfarculaceae bacterium]|nr:manganese efflux pump MntP family protein [Desulfarculaceae bacterium]